MLVSGGVAQKLCQQVLGGSKLCQKILSNNSVERSPYYPWGLLLVKTDGSFAALVLSAATRHPAGEGGQILVDILISCQQCIYNWPITQLCQGLSVYLSKIFVVQIFAYFCACNILTTGHFNSDYANINPEQSDSYSARPWPGWWASTRDSNEGPSEGS